MIAPSIPPSPSESPILQLLGKLAHSGPLGFEGLAARLLEGLTGKAFVVAASGRQPRGDATALDSQITLQAKRYKQTTTLNPQTVAADLLSAIDAAGGALDVYVVATTREASQLRQELEIYERQTGVDVVVIADDEQAPELTALCVAHWNVVKFFFPTAGQEVEAWVEDEATKPWVALAVARVKEKISFGLQTFHDLRQASNSALKRRFYPKNGQVSAAGVRVDLTDAVERAKPLGDLAGWWAQAKQPIAVLEAEEGYGKTWVGASFASTFSQPTEGPAAFWLESAEWSGCTTIEVLLTSVLRTILPAGDARADSYRTKILRLWPRPVLLVLDGVNERNCVETAQHLLRAYAHHESAYSTRLRILFTSRPLDNNPDYVPEVWEGVRGIPLEGFTREEFDKALRRFSPDVPPLSIPDNVRQIASVPRFFRLAMRLRERLRDLGQLTKPVLLFADLIDKIGSRRLTTLFPSASTAEDILAHWAKYSQRTAAGAILVADAHVQSCFTNFAQALADLAEHRIAEKKIGSVAVNADHVTLGFALHLLHLAEEKHLLNAEALSDELALALEPNREDDLRTEALYVALVLSLVRPPVQGNWTVARLALLSLWAGSHNARQRPARLTFWAATDTSIYQEMIELLFRDFLSGTQDTDLIKPIARRWREHGPADTTLVQRLERWLTLVYPSVDADDTLEEVAERASFPKARTQPQLRLTATALSIISLRPEKSMLPALVLAAYSCSFCSMITDWGGKQHKTPCKSPHEALSLLMKWHYTERIIPDLVTLAQSMPPRARAGVWSLAECMDLAALPPELVRPDRYNREPRPSETDAMLFDRFREWIETIPSAELHWPRISKVDLLCDRPSTQLADAECIKLVGFLKTILSISKGEPGIDAVAEVFSPLLPWVARDASDAVPSIATAYWRYAIKSSNPNGASIDAPIIPLPWSDLKALLEEVSVASTASTWQEDGCLQTAIFKIIAISTSDAELVDALAVMAGLRCSAFGPAWRILPVPYMLTCVQSPALAGACWARFNSARVHRDSTDYAHYWLQLAAVFSREEHALAEQALNEIRQLPVGHAWAPTLAEMIAASGAPALVANALQTRDFLAHLQTTAVRDRFAWFLRWPRNAELPLELRTQLLSLPAEIVAALLGFTNGPDEHVAFARVIGEAALRRVGVSGVAADPGYVLGWSRPLDERRAWWAIREAEPESNTSHSCFSLVWGVDRVASPSFPPGVTEELASRNTALGEAIRRSREKLAQAGDEFLNRFLGAGTLDRWAEAAPGEVCQFATTLFAKLGQDPLPHMEMSAFCEELLAAVALADLREAVRLHAQYFDRARPSYLMEGLIPNFVGRLMSAKLDAQGEIVVIERIQWVETCRDDHELLAVVMAAIHGGTVAWLLTLAREKYATSPLAKDRALSVSILAYAGEDPDLHWLAVRKQGDDSYWLRQHAAWAFEMRTLDARARQLWRQIEEESQRADAKVLNIACLYKRLEPFLLPMAILWPRKIPPHAKVHALQLGFWYSWRNRGGVKAEREVAGRRLKEQCRGHKIKDEARRMAPWWNPQV